MTQTIHIMTGLPASGKSTFARKLEVPRFNLDDYRAMLGLPYSKQNEALAVKAMIQGAHAVAGTGSDIVIDNTHLTKNLPKKYKDTFYDLPDARFEVHDFTGVSIAECIERDAKRTVGHVGEAVIWKLVASAQGAAKSGWKLTSEWMNERPVMVPYTPDPSLPAATLWDLDGNLAIHNGRGPYEFHRVEEDLVNLEVARQLRMHYEAGIVMILFSGRKGEFREHTERWLEANRRLIPYHELFTRPLDNNEPDDLIKLWMFDKYIRGQYNVLGVWDDRNRVVTMWRKLGLHCNQTNFGAF